MPRTSRAFSGYRQMWLFALFDLPVTTKGARKEYSSFRKALLKEGFTMLQFSVYARYCDSEEASEVFRRRIRKAMPPEGQVRVVSVTDRQFGKMETFIGKKRAANEEPPPQLLLF